MTLGNSNILSLSFSRNRLSFAVFRNGALDYYAGKTLRQHRTNRDRNRALTRTVDELVDAHNITELALPGLNKQQRHSPVLLTLYRTVRTHCLKKGLTISIQDPVYFRRQICGTAKPNKANSVRKLVNIYPELERYTRGGSEWESRYYGHLFTAIGAGLVAVRLHPSVSGKVEAV
jgi:hypothetical protein